MLLYAIASCLSFNISLILSMLFYAPPVSSNSRRSAQQPLQHGPAPADRAAAADDDERRMIAADNWEEVKRRAEAAAAAAGYGRLID